MNQNQPNQEEKKPINKLEIAISIAMAVIIFAVGYYVVLRTEESIASNPDVICCAPIQFNWLGFLVITVLSIMLGIVIRLTHIQGVDKHE